LWDTNVSIIADNFDQEAAIVALARWYLHKVAFEPKSNLRQWLDKLTIRWASFFATYIKGDIESFILPNKMKFLPQFVYHFRRNPIFRRVGLSLDELTYHSHSLNR
jgi:protein transport protein SEC23